MNAEVKAEWEAWLASRPPAVAAVARQYPPNVCYRGVGGRGHYQITSYGEPRSGGPITVRLAHGRDSFLPGVEVFGVDPAQLEPCGCGKWDWPTKEQVEQTAKRAEAISAKREAENN